MAIPQKTVDEILVKCARHCCICRKFQPNLLQVHHIIEQSNGGTHSSDNLIATCISCHASVHTSTGMTRAFTKDELKQHRDKVFELVADGRLPTSDFNPSTVKLVAEHFLETVIETQNIIRIANRPISDEALEILLAAFTENVPIRIIQTGKNLLKLSTGHQQFVYEGIFENSLPKCVQELIDTSLVRIRDDICHLTDDGFQFASKILKTDDTFIFKKCKCLECELHFIICTENQSHHTVNNIHCPECGQSNGQFLLWQQKVSGYISQFVPGKAELIGIPQTKQSRS